MQQGFHRGDFPGQDGAAQELRPCHRTAVELAIFDDPLLDVGNDIGAGVAGVGDEVVGIEMDRGVHEVSTSGVPCGGDPCADIHLAFPETCTELPRGFESPLDIAWGSGEVLLGLLDRTTDDFGLRDLPACGQAFEPQGRCFIQGERGSVSHCLHTISAYH